MALKFKISQKVYDGLSNDLKNEYIAGDKDGEFVLDVSDLPAAEDTGPIKRALESERNKSKGLKSQLDEANAKIADFPDVDSLKKTHETEVAKYKTFTEKTLRDGKAFELASKISTVPKLMAKEIAERIVVDMSGDEPVAKIKDKDGKVSDMTFDKLGEEFVANKEFSSILIGSRASGGGAPKPGAKPLGGGMPPKAGEQGERADLSKMTPVELAAHIASKKEANAEA